MRGGIKKIACLLLALAIVVLCGCAEQDRIENDEYRLSIVTTVFPAYDFVRAVGGDMVDVRMLIDPGTEIHSFDPTPSDIAAVYNADLFIYIGGESEKWVDRVLRDVNVPSLIMMSNVKRIEEEHDHSHAEHHDHDHENDEHVWTSPENALLMLQSICNALIELDPDNEAQYRANLEDYSDKIRELQTDIHELVLESESKFILVADRFPFLYFTEEFGIEHKAAFGGCAVSNDISLKVMGELVKTVREKNCTAAFYTEMSNRSIADALSEETGVRLYELHSAHNVTADDFKNGVTYVDIMKRNIESLRKGMY